MRISIALFFFLGQPAFLHAVVELDEIHKKEGPQTPSPQEIPGLSDSEKAALYEKMLPELKKRFIELKDEKRFKPIVRVESEAPPSNSTPASWKMQNPSRLGESNQERTLYTIKENTNVTPDDVLKGIRFMESLKQLYKVTDAAAQGNLDPRGFLERKNLIEASKQSIPNKDPVFIELSEDEGYMAYTLARLYLQEQAKKAAETQAQLSRKEEARRSAEQSRIHLSSSLDEGLQDYTSDPLSGSSLNSLGGQYLDLAAKQINNARGDRDRSSLSDLNGALQSPFSRGAPLTKLFDEAINASNSFDFGNQSLSERLKPFEKIINSDDFLEQGTSLLGLPGARALQSAVQAAQLLDKVGKNLNASAANYLGDAFNLGTGVAAPPCFGCVETKNSPLLSKADAKGVVGNDLGSKAQEWIQEANELANKAGRIKNVNPKEAALLQKGRIELDKLLAILDLYKSRGLLNSIEIPLELSPSKIYKSAAETAAAILFLVKQRKLTDRDVGSIEAEIKTVKKSASDLFEKLKATKNPIAVESALRDFFELQSHDSIRSLWRDHEESRYKKLRAATAEIIMTRRLALLKQPSFESVTLERTSLAYLVNRSFQSLKDRDEAALKARRRALSFQNEKTSNLKKAQKTQNPAKVDKTIRAPSFSEEVD